MTKDIVAKAYEDIQNVSKLLEGQNLKGLAPQELELNSLGNFALFGVVGAKLLQSWISYAYPYEAPKGNLRADYSAKKQEHEQKIDQKFKRKASINSPKLMEELASLDPDELAKRSGISTETVDEIMKAVVAVCKLHQINKQKPPRMCERKYTSAVKRREDKKRGQDL